MARFITLSRAARLVGIKRGTLQERIRKGELSAFEGEIDFAELLRVYPQTQVDDSAGLERFERIKDQAFVNRTRRGSLPDAETLAARLTALSQELALAKMQAAKFGRLFESTQQKLTELENNDDAKIGGAFAWFRSWLAEAREKYERADDFPEQLLVKDAFLRIMSAHVRIHPGGQEFFVEGNDTLLDAGLRAGLALNYGCSNGACGMCRGRVASGQVKKIRAHDYVLSEAEKNMGVMLMCCNTAVTDVVVEATIAGGVDDIPAQQIPARVRKMERAGDDLMVLHLRTPRTNRLRFLAGQFVTLTLPDGTREDHSIASCPCDDMNLQFHIPRVPGVDFSEYAFDKLKGMDTITVDGPKGGFVLEHEHALRPIVFIAHQAGFAPVKSLIEHAMALDALESIHLYRLTDRDTPYLHNLCRSWTDALDNFSYTPLITSPGRNNVAQALARVVAEHADLSRLDFYVAGPRETLEAAREVLVARGLPEKQLYLEAVREDTGARG